jgi:hypothetical protein
MYEKSKIWQPPRILLQANHVCPEETAQLLKETLGS